MSALSSSLFALSLLLGQCNPASGSGMLQTTGSTIGTATWAPEPPAWRSWFSFERRPFFARRHIQTSSCHCGNSMTPYTYGNTGTYTPATAVQGPLALMGGQGPVTALPQAPRQQQVTPQLPAISVESVPAGEPVVLLAAGPMVEARSESPRGPILPSLVNKMGRDENFAWVTGQLEIENGKYVLYYSPADAVDVCNGRVILHTEADMSKVGQGDLVSVTGQLQGQPGSGSVFFATTVTFIESPWQSGKND
jgi:hypothetical protein